MIDPPVPSPWPTYHVRGLRWPVHLRADAPFLPAQLTLMGPANALGAWRWYAASLPTGGHIRIKVNHLLLPVTYRLVPEPQAPTPPSPSPTYPPPLMSTPLNWSIDQLPALPQREAE